MKIQWLVCALPAALAGCWLGSDTDSGAGAGAGAGDPPECATNDDCAHLDTDDDACTAAICEYGECKEDLLLTAPDCQCHTADDCDYFEKGCNVLTCEAHQCIEAVAAEGPAAMQVSGDCAQTVCDGIAPEPTAQYDEADISDDGNECTIDVCDAATGVQHQRQPDGMSCNAGAGFCFVGKCLPCKPQDPDSCGGEGPSEPQNDSGDSPISYTRYGSVCGFSDATDVDWYTFYASDDFLSVDILDFDFWSTAPELEVCAYVTCKGGTPDGGCATKLPGPGDSLGCCWSGEPATLTPSWDLDCKGLDDRGTVYISIRTPGGSACESYAMTANY